MSEFGKTEAALLAFGVAGALALTGCSGDSPAPETSSSAASPTSEAAPLSPNVTVAPDHVDPSEVGALFDRGLTAAQEISDVTVEPDTINGAYQDAASIPNPYIRNAATAYVSWRIANSTIYTYQNIYSFDTDSTKKTVADEEAVVDRIRDPAVKAAAERRLDYTEATGAVKANADTRNATAKDVAAYLLTTIEDSTIKAEAQSAIAGDTKANDILEAGDTDAENAVKTAEGNAFSALYDGSNMKATGINTDIAALNKARQAAGN
jgi:hypothetical protein